MGRENRTADARLRSNRSRANALWRERKVDGNIKITNKQAVNQPLDVACVHCRLPCRRASKRRIACRAFDAKRVLDRAHPAHMNWGMLEEVDFEDTLQRQGSYSQNCRYIESWLEVRLYPYNFQQPKARDEQWTRRRGETGSFDSNGSWQT